MANHTLQGLRAGFVESLASRSTESLRWLFTTDRLSQEHERRVMDMLGCADHRQVREALAWARSLGQDDCAAFAAQHPRSLHPRRLEREWRALLAERGA